MSQAILSCMECGEKDTILFLGQQIIISENAVQQREPDPIFLVSLTLPAQNDSMLF